MYNGKFLTDTQTTVLKLVCKYADRHAIPSHIKHRTNSNSRLLLSGICRLQDLHLGLPVYKYISRLVDVLIDIHNKDDILNQVFTVDRCQDLVSEVAARVAPFSRQTNDALDVMDEKRIISALLPLFQFND